MGATLKIDMGQFRKMFKEYSQVTKRDFSTALNTTGFYIARGAVHETYRADKAKVRAELNALIKNPSGKHKLVKTANGADAPLVALLINARRGKRGEKGLTGAKMAKAVKSFIARRLRSIAFIASGGIPAIKAFEPYADKKGQAPRMDRAVRQYGKAKGSGTPAKPNTWTPFAKLVNSASANGDTKGALQQHYGTALTKSVAKEVRNMQAYMLSKMQQTARRFSAK